jgi:hypothetical protein
LLDREFLLRSTADGVFFVNIRYMFNGDRLAFVKAYQVTGTPAELPLPAPPILPPMKGIHFARCRGIVPSTVQTGEPMIVNEMGAGAASHRLFLRRRGFARV